MSMLSEEEKTMFNMINDYRQDPSRVKGTIRKLITAISRLNPNSDIPKKYEALLKTVDSIDSCDHLKIDNRLCEAAKDYLEQQEEPDDKVLIDNDMADILPEGFTTEKACLLFTDVESPELCLIKMNANNFDTNNEVRNHISDPMVTRAGIAFKKIDEEENMMCFILSQEGTKEVSFEAEGDDLDTKTPEENVLRGHAGKKPYKKRKHDDDFDRDIDLTELRLAFENLDVDKNERLRIKEICEGMDKEGMEKVNPTLYRMINELNDGRDVVTWEEFRDYFLESLGHKEKKKGRRDIYNVFRNYSVKTDDLDFKQLKEINEYLNLGYTDKEIRAMIRMTTRNKHGIKYEDYSDRVDDILDAEAKKAKPEEKKEFKEDQVQEEPKVEEDQKVEEEPKDNDMKIEKVENEPPKEEEALPDLEKGLEDINNFLDSNKDFQPEI